ncbi:hypothetical protein ACIBG8_19450 [Nonomuraea sp. NPDC050556]|uniref:hypothetical protein n=1 Tax=Nonomuraea sp. NPDC050556 TaxID=3364369 RepID=UPI0037916AC8
MTLEELQAKYPAWEFLPRLAIGVAAVRKDFHLTQAQYDKGRVLGLVGSTLDSLVPGLERQSRLT